MIFEKNKDFKKFEEEEDCAPKIAICKDCKVTGNMNSMMYILKHNNFQCLECFKKYEHKSVLSNGKDTNTNYF